MKNEHILGYLSHFWLIMSLIPLIYVMLTFVPVDLLLLLQNIAVFEREDDSSSPSDESSEESDDEIPDTHDSDTDSVQCGEHDDRDTQQTTLSSRLPRIKMPKTSSKRRAQPCVEVLHSSDSKVQHTSDDQLHHCDSNVQDTSDNQLH